MATLAALCTVAAASCASAEALGAAPFASATAASPASQPFSLLLPEDEAFKILQAEPDLGGPVVSAGTPEQREKWGYRRATTLEVVTTAVAAVGTAYFEYQNRENPRRAKWKDRNGFDENIREAVRLKSESARDVTSVAGEALMGVMIAAPFLETLSTLGFRDDNWDAQWQTQLINVESFTVTSLISSLMQNFLTRERPFVRNCRNGNCEGYLENRSMPSGHIAFALTGAGLMCNHHKYQEIYADTGRERAVCATAIGLSVADGMLRLLADRHYATDVIVGALIGGFSGFVLPRWLHYSKPVERVEEPQHRGRPAPVQLVAFKPEIHRDGAVLNCDFRY